MKISFLSVFFFFFLFLISPNSIINAQTTPTQCTHHSPTIQFPFNFNLSCSSNTTRIHFKSYDSLSIKSISYHPNRLDLVDLDACVHGAFLKLDLSVTPFRYFYVVNDYLYLNCTSKLPSPSPPIPCLSRPREYYVYVVREMETPSFCKRVKRVKIPFEYSPYIDDGSFGLSLTWGFENQTKTESKTECSFKPTSFQVLSIISLLVAMVTISSIVISMKIHHSRKQKLAKEEADKKLFENSYEALKTHSDNPIV